ncbi:MAG TPA: aminoglycoside phosphotransferase family protein [Ktedonobacterales bacterium]|nr:aminoglycoside phosphotransferase family protein [Ktedonobacterales bacterium]
MISQTLAPRDESALAELIRKTFGPACHIERYRLARRETDYTVLLAQLIRPELRVVVKLAGHMAALPCPFDRSAAINRLVRTHTNIPNSGVIAADVTYAHWPWRYMISTYLPGHAWMAVRPKLNDAELRAAHRQMGEAVAILHGVPFPQFGEVTPDGTVPFGAPYLSALTERVRRRVANPRHAELFLSLVRERAALFADVDKASLTHEDLNPNNILFHNEKGQWILSGILDFESAWAGCSESDLARLELWRGMAGDGFWEGYRSVRQAPPSYPLRRLLYQLLWCLEYPSTTQRHVADTRAVCAGLGIPADPFLA